MEDQQPANQRVRGRDNGGVQVEEERHVRARPNIQRAEPFVECVVPTIGNLDIVQGTNSTRRRQVGPNYRFLSMQDWKNNGAEQGTVMLLTVLSISTSSNPTNVQQRYNGTRGQVNSVRHSRKLTVMCHSSPSGHNTAMILQGNGHCPRLFDDPETRDNGEFRPGCTIILVNLPPSDRYLANGSTPIIATTRPAIVVRGNFEYPERPIVTEGTDLNGFHLHNCQISVTSFQTVDTPCGGDFCDQQSLMIGEVMSNRCACIQMKSRVGLAGIVWNIQVTLPNGTTFTTQMSSKWFGRKYIFTGPLPSGVRAAHLEDFEVEGRIYDTATSVTNLINNTAGGFKATGWTKRGEVQDQGVDQPNNGLPHNAPRVMVQAGTLNYHITRLDPMRPQDVDLDALQGLKFDVATLG